MYPWVLVVAEIGMPAVIEMSRHSRRSCRRREAAASGREHDVDRHVLVKAAEGSTGSSVSCRTWGQREDRREPGAAFEPVVPNSADRTNQHSIHELPPRRHPMSLGIGWISYCAGLEANPVGRVQTDMTIACAGAWTRHTRLTRSTIAGRSSRPV